MTPALADANNGNWRTAQRWARMLATAYRVRIAASLSEDTPAHARADLLIALHARRSAAAIAAWRARHPSRPLVVALTGTDLYRDIAVDPDAQHSLAVADALIVLNALGAHNLPAEHRAKCQVVLQSCSARRPLLAKPTRHLRALMVGHLRDEKSPQTYFELARRLHAQPGTPPIRLDHIGAALDPALGAEALALMASGAPYRWLGTLPHADTRRRIQAAHVLVHPSRMEGGAHVVTEAVRSGTPVLASRIDGNVGLLGADYAGYFDPGDVDGLHRLLLRCVTDAAILANLNAQCAARAPLFAPEAERAALLAIVAPLLMTSIRRP